MPADDVALAELVEGYLVPLEALDGVDETAERRLAEYLQRMPQTGATVERETAAVLADLTYRGCVAADAPVYRIGGRVIDSVAEITQLATDAMALSDEWSGPFMERLENPLTDFTYAIRVGDEYAEAERELLDELSRIRDELDPDAAFVDRTLASLLLESISLTWFQIGPRYRDRELTRALGSFEAVAAGAMAILRPPTTR